MKALICAGSPNVVDFTEDVRLILTECGIASEHVRSQDKAKEALRAAPPDIIILEDVLPPTEVSLRLTPSGSPPPMEGDQTIALPDIPKVTPQGEDPLFADSIGLAEWIAANVSQAKIFPFYRGKFGMPKVMKERFKALPTVVDLFPYPLSSTNEDKFKKKLRKVIEQK